jgi:hypothetical protein
MSNEWEIHALCMYYDHDYEIASALQDCFLFASTLQTNPSLDVKLFGGCHHP